MLTCAYCEMEVNELNTTAHIKVCHVLKPKMTYPKEFNDYTKQEEAGLISAFIQYIDIRFKERDPSMYYSWKKHVLPVIKEHALTCWGLPSREESEEILKQRSERRYPEKKKDNFNSIEEALKFLSERGINVKG